MSTCPTCQKQVYHAEQTMGPNRQMYHKPCLICVNCKTRLDPGGLQEHAGEAYCRNCHRMLFSPRDLRSANVYNPSTTSGPSTPTRQPAYRNSNQDSYSTPTRMKTTATTTKLSHVDLSHAEKSPTKGFSSVDDLISDQSRLDLNSSSTDDENTETKEEKSRTEEEEGYVPFRVVPRSSVRGTQPVEDPQARLFPGQEPFLSSPPSRALSSDSSTIEIQGVKKSGPPMIVPKPSALGSGRPLPLPPRPRSELASTESSTPRSMSADTGTLAPANIEARPTINPKPTELKPSADPQFEANSSTPPRPTNSTSSPARPSWTPSKTPLAYPTTPGTPRTAGTAAGTGDICPACEKRVYLMEAVTALSRKWHKGCLKCVECRSTLDPNKLCDRDGKVYCRKCYQNLFGPIGIR